MRRRRRAVWAVSFVGPLLVAGLGCPASETAPPGNIFGDRPTEAPDGGEDARGDARGDGAASDARDAGEDARDADAAGG